MSGCMVLKMKSLSTLLLVVINYSYTVTYNVEMRDARHDRNKQIDDTLPLLIEKLTWKIDVNYNNLKWEIIVFSLLAISFIIFEVIDSFHNDGVLTDDNF